MNLSAMKMISFEMSGHCNLAKKHPRCPVSLRKYVSKNRLTNEDILRVMDEAKALGFAGHFNFNYYNEPLMDLKRILSIISERKENMYCGRTGFCPIPASSKTPFFLCLIRWLSLAMTKKACFFPGT